MMQGLEKIIAYAAMAMSVNNPSPVLSITIATSKLVYTVGEPIHLDIVFSNPTTTPIGVWVSPNATQAEHFDDVNVSRSGESLKPSAYEQAMRSGQMPLSSRKQDIVNAENNGKDGMTLNKLFDLNAPGQYTVQIRYTGNGNPAEVGTSNIATFEVK